jgi:DNA helicase HerA-like ATPase
MRTDLSGRGIINILAADKLFLKPRLYSTFLLWLLSELFENLPEVGDLDKPRLAFFFDEAHLLFDDAPAALRQRIEQVVRLIRSKGVGVYFCSQFPDDVPNEILGQLGNRVQHALRAFTPRDQKAVKTAAETFVQNPALDVVQTISRLGTGEALTSMLMDKGIPSPVEKTVICPPRCRMGAITPEERAAVRARSPIGPRYDTAANRESAHEILTRRAQEAAAAREQAAATKDAARGKPAQVEEGGMGQKVNEWLFGTKRRQGVVDTMAKQTARTIGSKLGNQILRGVLGGIFKK